MADNAAPVSQTTLASASAALPTTLIKATVAFSPTPKPAVPTPRPAPASTTVLPATASSSLVPPTATIAPTRLPAGPIFRDDFSSPATGLPDNLSGDTEAVQSGYNNGGYQIQARPGTLTWATYPPRPASDFQAQVKLTLPNPDSFGGLIFWQISAQSYYALLLDAKGRWELAYLDGANWTVITKWASTPALSSGNLLQLETAGVNVKISFNGKMAALIKTDGPPSAPAWTVGLAGGTYQTAGATGPVEIIFNDFSYTQF